MKRYRIVITFSLAVSVIAVGILVYTGVIWPNTPSEKRYPVRGVDVSHYQGEIDWETLADQGICFAFIKATEGSTYQDSRFAYNWENANKTDLHIGVYHFFSYDSEGKTQAENYINTVPMVEGMLPPVVDVEFYADKEANPASWEKAQGILSDLIDALESYYEMKPIIYVTRGTYSLYLTDAYTEYDIWIRSILSKPHLPDHREWTFWQYSNRGRLDGYRGDKPYIDMNVFNGTLAEFQSYIGAVPIEKEE